MRLPLILLMLLAANVSAECISCELLEDAPDANILMFTFNKGQVDEFRMTPQQFATQTLPGSDFDKAGGVKVKSPQWAFSYIGWNQDGSNPFFNDADAGNIQVTFP